MSRETDFDLPNHSVNQQAVKIVRREKIQKMAEPTSLTGFDLPLALQKTHDAEQFFLHDSGSQDENRVFELAKIPGSDQLSLSDGCFCDGTFLTALYVFYQFNLIHFRLIHHMNYTT